MERYDLEVRRVHRLNCRKDRDSIRFIIDRARITFFYSFVKDSLQQSFAFRMDYE